MDYRGLSKSKICILVFFLVILPLSFFLWLMRFKEPSSQELSSDLGNLPPYHLFLFWTLPLIILGYFFSKRKFK